MVSNRPTTTWNQWPNIWLWGISQVASYLSKSGDLWVISSNVLFFSYFCVWIKILYFFRLVVAAIHTQDQAHSHTLARTLPGGWNRLLASPPTEIQPLLFFFQIRISLFLVGRLPWALFQVTSIKWFFWQREKKNGCHKISHRVPTCGTDIAERWSCSVSCRRGSVTVRSIEGCSCTL